MGRIIFPADYDQTACFLVPVPAGLVPLVAGALREYEERRTWSSDEEHERAYNAFVELEAYMLQLCVNDLIESNNRLYRMLDTAIFGTGYVVQSTEPLLVTPDIPPQRTIGIYDDASILGRMENLKQLLENGINGTETLQYNRSNGVRDLLEQLITAISETGQLDADMLARLTEIAALVA